MTSNATKKLTLTVVKSSAQSEESKQIKLPIFMESTKPHPERTFIKIDEDKVLTLIKFDSGFIEEGEEPHHKTLSLEKGNLHDLIYLFNNPDNPLQEFDKIIEQSDFSDAMKEAERIIRLNL